MNYHKLGEYDKMQLLEAKKLINKVYDYHYGDSIMRNEIKRLETIISKIQSLIDKAGE